MYGTTVVDMRVNTKMIKNMALVSILGLTVGAMKDIGSRVNSTASVVMLFLKRTNLSMVFGKMVRELNGSMRVRCS